MANIPPLCMWTFETNLPAGMAETYITGNFYLTHSQMETNVDFIYAWVKVNQPDWSIEALAGMLGNMQSESTINPGIWQSLQTPPFTNPDKHGYGLVQWTPYSKYITWCDANNIAPEYMESALARIVWEEANSQQWIATSYYNHSFSYFLRDTETDVETLAEAFLRNYERPDDIPGTAPARRSNAAAWYEYLKEIKPPEPEPQTRRKIPYIYYIRRF